MPFLTELDQRAEVKGSRDPLGLVPMWAALGREVVGNLTTVNGSVRGFTTLLVGLELADMLREQYRNDAPPVLDTFLRFEQLAAYARVKHRGDESVRGYRRASRRLAEQRKIRVSTEPKDQILSNQKTYGILGLFTTSARASGLVMDGDPRLTAEASSFVQRQYLPHLSLVLKHLLDILRRSAYELQPDSKDAPLLEALGRMHGRLGGKEKVFYRDTLAWGGRQDSTGGRQKALSSILAGVNGSGFGFAEFHSVRRQAQGNDALSDSLERIETLEHLISPAAILFGFLQDRDRQAVSSVSAQIRDTWSRPLRLNLDGLRTTQPRLAAALQSPQEASSWMSLAECLSVANYEEAIRYLIRINTAVMARRGGSAAWVTEENGMIRVRLTDERDGLVAVEEAENYWRSTYFINALWRVAREVNG